MTTPSRLRLSGLIFWAPAAFVPLLVLAVLVLGILTRVLELDPAIANVGFAAAVLVGGLLLLLWLLAAPMVRRFRLAGFALVLLPLVVVGVLFKVEDPHLFGDLLDARPFVRASAEAGHRRTPQRLDRSAIPLAKKE